MEWRCKHNLVQRGSLLGSSSVNKYRLNEKKKIMEYKLKVPFNI